MIIIQAFFSYLKQMQQIFRSSLFYKTQDIKTCATPTIKKGCEIFAAGSSQFAAFIFG